MMQRFASIPPSCLKKYLQLKLTTHNEYLQKKKREKKTLDNSFTVSKIEDLMPSSMMGDQARCENRDTI